MCSPWIEVCVLVGSNSAEWEWNYFTLRRGKSQLTQWGVWKVSMSSQNLFALFGIELLFAEICFNIGTSLSEKLILAYRLYQEAGWHGQ